jgi:nucleoside-diphosphate-sugar epimerase
MWTESRLDHALAKPSVALIEDMKRIGGDILVLGAGGKMGPSLCALAQNAARAAGIEKKVYAVSRFGDAETVRRLEEQGITVLPTDLLKEGALDELPDAENVIFMAGKKFGTNGQEPYTWAMNAWLPALVAQRYRNARIVAFSSGNLYPIVRAVSGGAAESVAPAPVGEYPQSVLARERCFEYGSLQYGTKVLLFRLNYAIDLRYGVLYDIARKVYSGETVSVSNPCFNCIWQGDANAIAIRCLLHGSSPAAKLNVTGPETVSVRYAAERFAQLFQVEPKISGEEPNDAYLSNSAECVRLFGYPSVCLDQMIRWQAEWILQGGRSLDKPTHFEEREGNY